MTVLISHLPLPEASGQHLSPQSALQHFFQAEGQTCFANQRIPFKKS